MPVEDEADRQLRAMVALIEGQAEQLVLLRRAVADLTGRLAIRSDLDGMVACQVEGPVEELKNVLQALRQQAPGAETLIAQADEQVRQLDGLASDLATAQSWGEPPIGRAPLERVPVLAAVERAFELAGLGARRTRVTTHIEPDLILVTSSPRLVAILVNLLDRATRRSPDGGADLRAWMIAPGVVRIQVVDSGPSLGGRDPESLFAAQSGHAGAGAGADVDWGELAETHAGLPSTVLEQPVLSLYLVRLLARSLGGDAVISDGRAPGPDGEAGTDLATGGTTVTIDLPQRRHED